MKTSKLDSILEVVQRVDKSWSCPRIQASRSEIKFTPVICILKSGYCLVNLQVKLNNLTFFIQGWCQNEEFLQKTTGNSNFEPIKVEISGKPMRVLGENKQQQCKHILKMVTQLPSDSKVRVVRGDLSCLKS